MSQVAKVLAGPNDKSSILGSKEATSNILVLDQPLPNGFITLANPTNSVQEIVLAYSDSGSPYAYIVKRAQRGTKAIDTIAVGWSATWIPPITKRLPQPPINVETAFEGTPGPTGAPGRDGTDGINAYDWPIAFSADIAVAPDPGDTGFVMTVENVRDKDGSAITLPETPFQALAWLEIDGGSTVDGGTTLGVCILALEVDGDLLYFGRTDDYTLEITTDWKLSAMQLLPGGDVAVFAGPS